MGCPWGACPWIAHGRRRNQLLTEIMWNNVDRRARVSVVQLLTFVAVRTRPQPQRSFLLRVTDAAFSRQDFSTLFLLLEVSKGLVFVYYDSCCNNPLVFRADILPHHLRIPPTQHTTHTHGKNRAGRNGEIDRCLRAGGRAGANSGPPESQPRRAAAAERPLAGGRSGKGLLDDVAVARRSRSREFVTVGMRPTM